MRGLNVSGYNLFGSKPAIIHCILYFRSFFMVVIERYVYKYTVHSYNSIKCGVLLIRGTLEASRIKKNVVDISEKSIYFFLKVKFP